MTFDLDIWQACLSWPCLCTFVGQGYGSKFTVTGEKISQEENVLWHPDACVEYYGQQWEIRRQPHNPEDVAKLFPRLIPLPVRCTKAAGATTSEGFSRHQTSSPMLLSSKSLWVYAVIAAPLSCRLWANVTSSTKPEVHKVLHNRQRRAMPRPGSSCTKITNTRSQ